MKVLVTGHDGYIGTVLAPMLIEAGHEVVGLDTNLFRSCTFGEAGEVVPSWERDIRDVTPADLEGFDAVCHLAGISNDPLGDLRPQITDEINHRASVALARSAKEAGVRRFIFSSSCSIYGASPGAVVDEESSIHPVTPYGWSKIHSEEGISELVDEEFSATFLRNATAYGVSSRLRADLVVNNLVGYAVLQGRVLMKSDGTPWRPLIHIEDISRAFRSVLEAPIERVHGRVFNVVPPGENYQIRDVARLVEKVVPGAAVELADDAGPDIRDYRVDSSRFTEAVPGFQPQWTVERGVKQLYEAFCRHQLTEEDFFGKLLRIRYVKERQEQGRLSDDLRPVFSTDG